MLIKHKKVNKSFAMQTEQLLAFRVTQAAIPLSVFPTGAGKSGRKGQFGVSYLLFDGKISAKVVGAVVSLVKETVGNW